MMKHLYTARDTMEAHFLRGLLEARGIEAVVQGEMLAAGRGELPMTNDTLPSIWVREADLQKAQVVLRDYREGRPPAEIGPPWRCPRCGEVIEPQFSHCWRCGMERPETIDPVPVQPIEGPVRLEYEPEVPEEPESLWPQEQEEWDRDHVEDED